jgi:hypothetical protein
MLIFTSFLHRKVNFLENFYAAFAILLKGKIVATSGRKGSWESNRYGLTAGTTFLMIRLFNKQAIYLLVGVIMKFSSIFIFALISIGTMSSSIAAQDQALIQQTRKNQLAYDARQLASMQATTDSTKAALPHDHAPRVTAAPLDNQQRQPASQEQGNAQSSEKDN